MNYEHCDIAVLTVIGPELRAVQKAIKTRLIDDRFYDNGDIYWRTFFFSRFHKRKLNIILHCLSTAGEVAASTGATKIIERFTPKFMLLIGISAGRRGKVKIGDIAIPRSVVDCTLSVAEKGSRKMRPSIPELPHSVGQMLRAFELNVDEWHRKFSSIFREQIQIPPGRETEYEVHVAKLPTLFECSIASADVLIRDPNVLENLSNTVHQHIYIGEMEAAGFIKACQYRTPIIPWFIIRGVSDFGDNFKSDIFHSFASCSAASYMSCFIKTGLDLGAITHSQNINTHSTQKISFTILIDALRHIIGMVKRYQPIDAFNMECISEMKLIFVDVVDSRGIYSKLSDVITLLDSYNQLSRRPGASDIIINYLTSSSLSVKIIELIEVLEASK